MSKNKGTENKTMTFSISFLPYSLFLSRLLSYISCTCRHFFQLKDVEQIPERGQHNDQGDKNAYQQKLLRLQWAGSVCRRHIRWDDIGILGHSPRKQQECHCS